MSADDLQAIWVTIRLASTVTVLLLMIGTPIAYWLARTNSIWRAPISAIVALPLVLPPTVIGFYTLVMLGPNGPVGKALDFLGIGPLVFTFWGLVIASLFYALPFVVQPIQNAISSIDERHLEAATTLHASPWDRFWSVIFPLARPGFLTAGVLGFAHTVGEFGVVLMIGGNIPGKTKVVSVAIYDHVEALEYGQAHRLSLLLLGFAFVILLALYVLRNRKGEGMSW